MDELMETGQLSLISCGISWSELYKRWQGFIDGKAPTKTAYTRAVNIFLNWLNDNGISAPTKADIIAFKEYLKSKYANNTACLYLTGVKHFFSFLDEENIYKDIAKNVSSPKKSNQFEKDYLTTGQIKTILNSIDTTTIIGKRNAALFLVMVTTGLREFEIAAAKYGGLHIRGDYLTLDILGKGKDSLDFVKIEPEVEVYLRDYLSTRSNLNGNSYLFASVSNNNRSVSLNRQSISKIIKGLMKNVGLDKKELTAHSLRHTAATQSLLNGATIQETCQFMRHSSIAMINRYAHNLSKLENGNSGKITKAIFD